VVCPGFTLGIAIRNLSAVDRRIACSPSTASAPLLDELVPFLLARSGQALDELGRWVAPRRPLEWVLGMLEYLPMTTLTREDLLWRFGKSEDPEIEARRQRILEVLLEASHSHQGR
jgi:hypothetical protein